MLVHWSRDTTVFGVTDTLQVDAVGRFADLIRPTPDDSIWIVVSASGDSPYYQSAVVIPVSRLASEIRIMLVPRRWTIHRGRFTGETIAVDPRAALRRSPDRASFARVTSRRTVGWARDGYPIPLVFRHGHGHGARIAPSDSAAFWAAATAIDDAIGSPLFRPWSDTAMIGRIFPVDVKVERIAPAAVTYVSWDRDGNIFEGSVTFRSVTALREFSVAEHELMHVLGFGHTTAWPSAVEAAGGRTITPEDVAYAQLLLRAHELEADPLLVGGLADAR